MFVELTRHGGGKIRIAARHIVAFHLTTLSYGVVTEVVTGFGIFVVTETPEQIDTAAAYAVLNHEQWLEFNKQKQS